MAPQACEARKLLAIPRPMHFNKACLRMLLSPISISADPCRQQGERVRGGLTSNKMPEGAKSLCRTKAGSRRTRAGWQLAM